MHGTGCLGLVHWDDPEGGEEREEGGGFRMGNEGIPVVDSFQYLAKLINADFDQGQMAGGRLPEWMAAGSH